MSKQRSFLPGETKRVGFGGLEAQAQRSNAEEKIITIHPCRGG